MSFIRRNWSWRWEIRETEKFKRRFLEAQRIFHFANFATSLGKLLKEDSLVGFFFPASSETTQLKKASFDNFQLLPNLKVLIDFSFLALPLFFSKLLCHISRLLKMREKHDNLLPNVHSSFLFALLKMNLDERKMNFKVNKKKVARQKLK